MTPFVDAGCKRQPIIQATAISPALLPIRCLAKYTGYRNVLLE
ncbi:hypothetical protein [Burkholderia sp.]|nr:hypothetical protein [Burkholderia sp.]